MLLDDGRLRLQVTAKHSDAVDTQVIAGGELSDRKGVNVPEAVLQLSPLTEKDRRDLTFGLELGVDWVALSFVQRQKTSSKRELIQGKALLMAKIEKPSAVVHLEEIAKLCDAIMVARGDLGVEVPAENVPRIQKDIIRTCRQLGKPVVVATQMLESMRFRQHRRGPKSPTWPTPWPKAPMRSCSRRKPLPVITRKSRADDEQDHSPGGKRPGLPGPARR